MIELVAATEEATATVQELIDKIAELDSKVVTITVKTVGDVGDGGLGGVPGEAARAAEAVHGLAIAWTEDEAAAAAAAGAAAAFGRDVDRAAVAAEDLRIRIEDSIAAMTEYEYGIVRARIADAEFDRSLIETGRGTFAYAEAIGRLGPAFLISADSARVAADATRAAGDAARTAGAAAGGAWRPWWLLGNTWRTALHWIVAGSAEVLAVAVPALIALGAGLLVALQGAQNAQRHFTALYAATESTAAAFHTTVGDVLGLNHALQTAQNSANPGVYELLGSVINDAKSRFADFAGAGLQVVHMLDEFAARITVDLKGTLGAQLHAFLGSMVQDLQQIGQVLGNFGHALLNVFSAMPGLVHVLLGTVDALSQFVSWLSRAPAGLLTFGIAMEEVFRWGGLLLGVLARLAGGGALLTSFAAGGGFITRFGAAIKALVVQGGLGVIWIGQMIGKLAGIAPVAAEAGAGIEALGMEIAIAGETMSTGMIAGIAVAAAALTFLVFKLASAKDATQQWVASSDQMVAKASDLRVLPTIYSQLAATTTKLAATQGTLATQTGIVNARFATGHDAVVGASTDSQALAGHLLSLVATADTVRSNINLLAGAFHTSSIGALALANAAGINLQAGMTKGSTALKIAVQQINNLKAGLGAMAAPAGVIGADMEAVGIQSQLAASKVQNVNQALDQFVGTLTGGMTGLSQFEAALHTMGHDALSSSVGIDGAIRSISRSAASMGFTLQGFGPKAQQSWQQFGQAVNQGQQVLDTFRTGMAEGMVSAGQYNKAILDVAGSLLPFAAHSKTATAIVSALAQQAGLPATSNFRTLAAQLGITGKAAQNQLAAGMERAIVKMSSMSAVARNLSATVSGQLDTAMAGAIVKASGLDNAYLKWATDVNANKAPQTLATDLKAIQTAQNFVNTAEAKGTTVLNNSTKAAGNLGAAYKGAASTALDYSKTVSQIHTELDKGVISSKVAALSTQGLSSQTKTAAGTASGLATQAGQASTQVKTLGTAAGITRGSLGTVNNEIRNTATYAGNTRGPLGTMSNEISNVGAAAGAAAGQVHALATAMAGLQSKTVTLTVNTVNTSTTIARHAAGTLSAPPGLAWVGERGPELMAFAGGERVYSHPESVRVAAGAYTGGGGGAVQTGGFGAPGSAEVHSHISVNLDGRQIWKSVQTQALQWQVRNSGRATGLTVPQAPGPLT